MTDLTTACRERGMTLEMLAEAVGRKRNTVKKWGRERRVPAESVQPLVRALDGAVTPHDLRPDLYPSDSKPRRSPSHEARA